MKMEVLLYCRGILIIISLSSIRSSRINKDLNKDFLEDIKRLNLTSNFRHAQTPNGLSLANSRNKTTRTRSKLNSLIIKSDSRNYTHAEIRDWIETVTKVQSFDRKQHVPTTKDGNVEQKETSLKPLNDTYYIRVTQEDELIGSENKKKGAVHTDNDQNENVEDANARLTDNNYAEDQRSKEEQINHEREHPYTEKSVDETKTTDEEIKPVTTGDKTRMPFDHGTTKKPPQNTTENLLKNNSQSANPNTQITNKNDSTHMRENNLHEAVTRVKSSSKLGSKFEYTTITYSTVMTKNTHVEEEEVKGEMNKFTNSKLSMKPFINIQDRSKNESVKTSLQNNVFNNITLQPRTRTEAMASHEVQEPKELTVTSEPKSDEDNKKGTSIVETLKPKIASKNINVTVSSVKATNDLKTSDLVLNTKSYSTTELTEVIKITKERPLVESEQTDLLYESNLAENEMSDGSCQCADDPSKEYTGSALVAAAVGGVIIGAFAVFLLFHLKQRCRNYINGDYRRVPMEYDFELNPRLKTH